MPLQPYITPLSSSLNLEYKKLTHVVGRCRSTLFCLQTHQMSPHPTHGHNEGHNHIVSLTTKGLCLPMWTKLRHSVTKEWGDPAMRSQSSTQGLRLVNLAMHICISFKITKTSLGYTLSIRGPNSKNPTVQLKYW